MFSIYPLSFPLQPGFHLLYLYLRLLTVCLVCFFVLPLLFYISCPLPPWCSVPGTSVVMLHLWLSPQLFSSPYTLPCMLILVHCLVDPFASLVFFGVQSGSKLDSSSAAILVISSSEANSSFSLFLCSSLLLRYSSRFSLFTFLSSVLANGMSTLPM